MKYIGKNKRYLALFAVVFALIMARYCCYGFEYWYQLDDYIQYHNYTFGTDNVWVDVVVRLGLLAARPLAGLADVYVWSRFFPVMLIGAAVVSLMFSAAVCFLFSVFRRHFNTGVLFAVFFALLPLGLEGTYWMSASTRIVTGLFFAAMSVWCFDKFLRGDGAVFAVLYAVCQLISYGFYEQMTPFSAAAVILLAIISWKKSKWRGLVCLWSFAAAVLYFLFVSTRGESPLYGAKTGYLLPNSAYYFDTFLPGVLSQIKSVFLGGGFNTLTKAGVRGLAMLSADRLWIYGFVLLVLAILLFFMAVGFGRRDVRRPLAAVIVGLLLTLAPLFPFFIAESAWFSFRGAVCSLCGLALIADTVLRLIFSRLRSGMLIVAVITTFFAMWCCICAVSDIHDYKLTTEKDAEISETIAERLVADRNTNEELKIGVLNLYPTYLTEQNSYFHEHIHGVTESDWALTGAVRYRLEMRDSPTVTPIPAGEMYAAWNRDAMQLDNFDVLYLYDGEETLSPVTAAKQADGSFLVLDSNGSVAATAWEENGIGYLRFISPRFISSAPS